MIDFKGVHYPKTVILYAMFFYVCYAVSYRDLKEILAEHRDMAAARRFFKRAISTNGVPDRVVIDKSVANLAGMQAVNVILKFTGTGALG